MPLNKVYKQLQGLLPQEYTFDRWGNQLNIFTGNYAVAIDFSNSPEPTNKQLASIAYHIISAFDREK